MTVPNSEQLITIYGGRCQECGIEYGEGCHGGLAEEERQRLRDEIAREWNKRGRGEYWSVGYPKMIPAWLVREGFRCTVCHAPDLLLDLGGVPR